MLKSLQFCWHINSYQSALFFQTSYSCRTRCHRCSLPSLSGYTGTTFQAVVGVESGRSARCRASFSSQNQLRHSSLDLPELLEIQRASFHRFVKQDITNLFSQINPIKIEQKNRTFQLILNAANFQLIVPDENPRDCILNMKTYSCKLYVQVKIVCTSPCNEIVYSTKSEWILIGHLPIMTKRGHFIINGSARVIVHQVVRSPGLYFQQTLEKDENKRINFYGDIIPRRGVWVRLQITKKGKIEAKFKKGKKLLAHLLQKCLHFIERQEKKSLLEPSFYQVQKSTTSEPNKENREISSFANETEQKALLYTYNRLYRPVEEKEEITKSGRQLTLPAGNPAKSIRTASEASHMRDIFSTRPSSPRFFANNVLVDKRSQLQRSYQNLFSTFKDKNRYDLSDLGREKINTKLGISLVDKQLTSLDLYMASNWLYRLAKGEINIDDIDHFQNRRIRSSGELLCIQFENGIERLRRYVWNKLKDAIHSQPIQKEKNGFDLHSKWNISANSSLSSKMAIKVQPLEKEMNLFTFDINQFGAPNLLSDRCLPPRSRQHHVVGSASAATPLSRSAVVPLPATGTGPWYQSVVPLRSPRYRVRGRPVAGITTYPPRPGLRTSIATLWQNNRKENTSLLKKTLTNSSRHEEIKLPTLSISIKELFSTKPLNGALRELFGSNPLCQYMDQTNPLAEITHKRRMSSLGIGGVSRESAGMAIRGIHPTHYGRICPIETPEGKNAGLVNSLAFYAKINQEGFIETPYYKVLKGQVQQELGFTFFSAKHESASHLKIAPSDIEQSQTHVLRTDSVPVRAADNLLDIFQKVDNYQVDCIAVSPVQMISVATSLIPFLEHNDANRALMGSNMQRQAVPLMIPERPIVGTGFESLVVAESGHLVQSNCTGFVSYASADKIVIESLFFASRIGQVESISLQKSPFFPEVALNCTALPRGTGAVPLLGSFSVTPRYSDTTLSHRKLPPSSQVQEKISHLKSQRKTILRKSYFSSCMSAQVPRHNVRERSVFKQSLRRRPISAFSFAIKPEKDIAIRPEQVNSPLTTLQSVWLANTSCSTTQELRVSVHVLNNFDRSNQDTCLTQRALVKEGDWVQRGDILTDCSASEQGELAVGKNILVAYLPWEGYNFEDAIVISERLVKEQVYTSLHIERYDFHAQDVKEGQEWFTNDLPGVTVRKLHHLNEFGLPKIGTFVKEGDILVGKMRYSNKKPTTPYERLLCDILGENNFSARDSSLYVPKGVHARVIKQKVLTFFEDQLRSPTLVGNVTPGYHVRGSLTAAYPVRSRSRQARESLQLPLRGAATPPLRGQVTPLYGSPSSSPTISRQHLGGQIQNQIISTHFADTNRIDVLKADANNFEIFSQNRTVQSYRETLITQRLKPRLEKRIEHISQFSAQPRKLIELAAKLLSKRDVGQVKSVVESTPDTRQLQRNKLPRLVHIFLGEKRSIQVGDKMSGRHGNKGVVAKILPRQDMPYLPNGTPIDIILNPLGVPSRMNVGQVFESLLGLAGTYLVQNFQIMAFDELYGSEASQSLVYLKLYQARLQSGQNWLFQLDFPGKTRLTDARSGECFDQWITVGKAYMLKLIHMVNEKIHARATGPYALITQQPLRGRSQKGGQRLGEMEVWALEGFGAAYTLQELLTKKSDDIVGRKEIISAILPRPTSILERIHPLNRIQDSRLVLGQPEIFKVLICELQALCLDVGVYSLTSESFQRSFLSKVH